MPLSGIFRIFFIKIKTIFLHISHENIIFAEDKHIIKLSQVQKL